MLKNTINYRPEYALDENGHRKRFKVDHEGNYIFKNGSKYNPGKEGYRFIATDSLLVDGKGEYFRQWRPEIRKPDDIWNEIVKVTDIPGLTSAPKLQPIETRLVMLSTGMRAPMGLKVFGPDLDAIEAAGLQLEQALKEVPSVKASSVFYDRAVGAPYVEINLNREAMARYGMSVNDVQEVLQVAVGGMTLSTSVEGRQRFPLRARYAVIAR
ncbi:MAG: efflux RND transporter permease subunit [Bacteroidales bacterium]